MKNIKLGNRILKNMEKISSNLKLEMSESHVSPFIINKVQKNEDKTTKLPKVSLLPSKMINDKNYITK